MQLVFKLLVLKYISSDEDVPASDTVSEISSKNTKFHQKSPSFLLNINSTIFSQEASVYLFSMRISGAGRLKTAVTGRRRRRRGVVGALAIPLGAPHLSSVRVKIAQLERYFLVEFDQL